MLKHQDNGVSLLTTVRKKPEDTGKILGLVFRAVAFCAHRRPPEVHGVVSDITKLQDVAISQLFKPEDPAKGESTERSSGGRMVGAEARRCALCYKDRCQATVPQSDTCPLAS